jgi:hypothetical protein
MEEEARDAMDSARHLCNLDKNGAFNAGTSTSDQVPVVEVSSEWLI